MTERFVRTVLGPFRLEEDKGALTALEPVDRLPEGQSFGGASTDLLLAAEKALCAYLAGGPSDVDSLPLLLPEAPFARKVLEAMRAIPLFLPDAPFALNVPYAWRPIPRG